MCCATASTGSGSKSLSYARRMAGGKFIRFGSATAVCSGGSWSLSRSSCEIEELCGGIGDMQSCN